MIGVGKSADVAELVDALDLGSSTFGVRVRVSASALLGFQSFLSLCFGYFMIFCLRG
jgi:hypothetical protein